MEEERSARGTISIGNCIEERNHRGTYCTEESVVQRKIILFDFKIQLHRSVRGNCFQHTSSHLGQLPTWQLQAEDLVNLVPYHLYFNRFRISLICIYMRTEWMYELLNFSFNGLRIKVCIELAKNDVYIIIRGKYYFIWSKIFINYNYGL